MSLHLNQPDGYAKVGTLPSYCRAPVPLPGGGFAGIGSAGQENTFQGAVLVFTAAGDLAPSFDSDGHLPMAEDWVTGVAGLPGGGMLVQLQRLNDALTPPESVVRLSAAGALDPSFGDGGPSTAGFMFGFGIATTTAGGAYAAAWDPPTVLHVRALPVP